MIERLKLLRNKKGKSQKEMAGILGISQGAYSQIENGLISLSADHLLTLSREFNLSIDWIMQGRQKLQANYGESDFIPLVSSSAKAGYIENLGNTSFLDTLELFKIPGFTRGTYRIFEVEGDSMNPTLLSNDYIICSRVESFHDILDGTVCVVVSQEGVVIKRIIKNNIDKNTFILKSDNPAYKPYQLFVDQVKEFWIVNAKLTTALHPSTMDQEKRIKKLEEQVEALLQKFIE